VPESAFSPHLPRIVRFGAFEVDFDARELRKRGLRLRVQRKPFQILELLLARRGELVTRQEIAERLWPGLYVNFDHSLNTAVNTLRQVLSDSPRTPRFIETRPGLGYIFVAPIEPVGTQSSVPSQTERIESLAVLPFENTAHDPATDYLGDGIADNVISSLSTLPGLRIVARTTAFRYRDPSADPAEIGRQLGVRALLMGKVTQRGDSLSVSSELIDSQTGWRLWGEQFERPAADAMTIERSIATRISTALRMHLDGQQRGRIAKQHTGNSEAYQNFLKGRFFYNKMTPDALQTSIAHFESAIAADPDYALAYAGLADVHSLFAFLNVLPSDQALVRARDLATTALRLDDELAEAHASLAGVKKLYDWDWEGAEREYLRALELNPNYAAGRQSYAAHLSAQGRSEEALREIRLAQQLDPLSLVINMEFAWHLYMARDFEASREQSLKTLELEPHFPAALHTLGIACEQLGEHDAAITHFRNACAFSGNHPAARAALAHAYAGSGRLDESRRVLQDLENTQSERGLSPYWLSVVYCELGEGDAAIAKLQQGLERRDVWMVWLAVEPRLDRLRPDPRFAELLRRIRLHNRAFTAIP